MRDLEGTLARLGLDLGSVLEHSFKNFHARGVDYVCLRRSPAHTRKLYLFNGDVSTFPEVVNPHDHRYPFRTRVISGALRNDILARSPDGVVFDEFEWRTPLNGGKGFTWKAETRLVRIDMQAYGPGDTHYMAHDSIHTIKVLKNQTAILQDQFADVVPLDQPTMTFTLTGKEPPNLAGLYEKFTADDVAARLPMIERALGPGETWATWNSGPQGETKP